METKESSMLSLYQFEYDIIPWLLEQSLKNCATINNLIAHMSDREWILDIVLRNLKLTCDFDTEEFSSDVIMIDDEHVVIGYYFPFPQRAPLAKFGAIFLNNGTGRACYYTLERFEYKDSGWVLGSMSARGHLNFGRVEDCETIEDFIFLLEQKGFMKKEKKGFLEWLRKLILKLYSRINIRYSRINILID